MGYMFYLKDDYGNILMKSEDIEKINLESQKLIKEGIVTYIDEKKIIME